VATNTIKVDKDKIPIEMESNGFLRTELNILIIWILKQVTKSCLILGHDVLIYIPAYHWRVYWW